MVNFASHFNYIIELITKNIFEPIQKDYLETIKNIVLLINERDNKNYSTIIYPYSETIFLNIPLKHSEAILDKDIFSNKEQQIIENYFSTLQDFKNIKSFIHTIFTKYAILKHICYLLPEYFYKTYFHEYIEDTYDINKRDNFLSLVQKHNELNMNLYRNLIQEKLCYYIGYRMLL